ncbi:hypothetical protein [Brevundimonas sp.]|uniref:hypothetical protein n=1 Tax=Brevundimonas sp. TaxID=1871086 RepID=UPI0027315648|nr:hypothetical protein [Brevundimonas sp.]MDP1914053.1 hypothetical protein [Brevundimonas sp.]
MTGNQDKNTLTGRCLEVLEQLLADAVATAGETPPPEGRDRKSHIRELNILAGLARSLMTAKSALHRFEHGLTKLAAERRPAMGMSPAMEDEGMNDADILGGGLFDPAMLAANRAQLFGRLDAVLAGRASGGPGARADTDRDDHGGEPLVADLAGPTGGELAVAAQT